MFWLMLPNQDTPRELLINTIFEVHVQRSHFRSLEIQKPLHCINLHMSEVCSYIQIYFELLLMKLGQSLGSIAIHCLTVHPTKIPVVRVTFYLVLSPGYEVEI